MICGPTECRITNHGRVISVNIRARLDKDLRDVYVPTIDRIMERRFAIVKGVNLAALPN